MTTDLKLEWPNVFFQPLDAPYYADCTPLERRGIALADALTAWEILEMGNYPPENFGVVIMKLGEIAGCTPTPYGGYLKKACEDWKREWDRAHPTGFV